MKQFAIILSGCGVHDGSEIHESVLSMLAVKLHKADYQVFAPDMPQLNVINHYTGDPMPEERNVLIESARIARSNIKPLDELDMREFDALLLPGGFGAIGNLSTYAIDWRKCVVHPLVAKVIKEALSLRKPIGALCISPVILAMLIPEVQITIGNDKSIANTAVQLGAIHVDAKQGEVIIDKKHKIFTTPCYMLNADITQIAESANNIVENMLREM